MRLKPRDRVREELVRAQTTILDRIRQVVGEGRPDTRDEVVKIHVEHLLDIANALDWLDRLPHENQS